MAMSVILLSVAMTPSDEKAPAVSRRPSSRTRGDPAARSLGLTRATHAGPSPVPWIVAAIGAGSRPFG